MDKSKLTLAQIGLYNPQRLTDEQSKILFSIRNNQFNLIMERINRTSPDDIPQHQLIIGLRGMGKSTLLKRLEVELRSNNYKKNFIPLLFPEEQYNIKCLADFWLNCIDAMLDTIEQEHEKELTIKIEEVDEVVQNMMKITNNNERGEKSYEFLSILTRMLKRRPVLLIDNINLIFDRMDNEDQLRLRSHMNESGAPIIIGTSTGIFEETTDYKAPFYDAFQIIRLNRLNTNEFKTMLMNLANAIGEPELISKIKEQEARLKALCQLTGGNPRTSVMFFRLIQKGFSTNINDDLEGVLDELTPLYKARFEELSLQAQVIIDAIAMYWEPISLEKLREITFLENSKLSPQLKRLSESGWIEKPLSQQGKGGAYEISERIFNIWYLMRRSSRRQKKSIFCLSKFMEVYYGEEIKEMAERYLLTPITSDSQAITLLAIARNTPDKFTKEKLYNKSREYIFDHFNTNELSQQFDFNDLYAIDSDSELNEKINEKFKIHNFKEANYLIQSSLQKSNSDKEKAIRYFQLSWINLMQNNLDIAYNYINQGLEIEPKNSYLYLSLAMYHAKNNEFNKGKDACIKSVRSDDTNIVAHFILATIFYDQSGQYKEAEEHLKKVCKYFSTENIYRLILAKNLYKQNKFKQALSILVKLQDDPEFQLEVCDLLGSIYLFTDNIEKAKQVYNKMLDINPESANALVGLSIISFTLGKYEDAISLLQKSLALEPNNIGALLHLAITYSYMKKDSLAYPIYQKLLNIYKEYFIYKLTAECAERQQLYQDALNLYEESIKEKLYTDDTWVEIGKIYQFNLRDYETAKRKYEEGLEIYPRSEKLLYNLLHISRDYLFMDEEKTMIIMERIFPEDERKSNFSYQIENVLFALQSKNYGIVNKLLSDILEKTSLQDVATNQNMWNYLAAQLIRNKQENILIEKLEIHNKEKEFAPYYFAIKAIQSGNIDYYMDTIVQELRKISIDIVNKIKDLI